MTPEQKKERSKIIRRNKKTSSEEIARIIKPFLMDLKKATNVVDRIRYQVTNDEWANMMRWSITKGESRVKPWASIACQAYGYNYECDYVLDTGYKKHETTLYDSEGWYTE